MAYRCLGSFDPQAHHAGWFYPDLEYEGHHQLLQAWQVVQSVAIAFGGALMDALEHFEAMIRADELKGLIADFILRKLEAIDPTNPEYLDRGVDRDWQMFRKGFLAGVAKQ